jgi:hypothetical protein
MGCELADQHGEHRTAIARVDALQVPPHTQSSGPPIFGSKPPKRSVILSTRATIHGH